MRNISLAHKLHGVRTGKQRGVRTHSLVYGQERGMVRVDSLVPSKLCSCALVPWIADGQEDHAHEMLHWGWGLV